MTQPLIVLGDKTSHGGTVITCSPTCDTMGKGWARVGTWCPVPAAKACSRSARATPACMKELK